MKIFIPDIAWVGNYRKFFLDAMKDDAIEVVSNTNRFKANPLIHRFKLHLISKIREWDRQQAMQEYNKKVIGECVKAMPDIFMVMNESKLYPTTIKTIREKCRCIMVGIVADDPWDSIRYKADFPHSLKYFDFIFTGEPLFSINMKRVAPKGKIYYHYGGFDQEMHHPVEESSILKNDVEKFTCDISFTGSSYGPKAEGAYRSDILSYLTDFNLKIWGDDNWPYRFKYLPQLQDCYRGTRLPYDDLRKLYHLSKINLNLPAPQVLTGFQPRVFEIAACKGFQIADHRPLLRKLFTEEELVTFETIGELKEKIRYYLDHETERNEITERLYKKVTEKYTWKNWAKQILDTIAHPEDYESL